MSEEFSKDSLVTASKRSKIMVEIIFLYLIGLILSFIVSSSKSTIVVFGVGFIATICVIYGLYLNFKEIRQSLNDSNSLKFLNAFSKIVVFLVGLLFLVAVIGKSFF